jgi:uncharacterized protein (TIGR02594 family)
MTYQTDLITSVQQALADLNFYTGPIDGTVNPQLEIATAAFKAAHGMLSRPYPGPLTLAALFGGNALKAADASITSDTPWLDWMIRFIGVKEVPGTTHNPLIVQWGKDAGISWWHRDEDAWCAVAVNAALVNTGFPSTKSALARSFTNYGTKLDKPVPGAIVVFPRGSNPLYGHVGVIEKVGDDGTSITVINGNVANAMRRTVYRTSSAIAFRAPPGSALAGGS